MRIDANRLRLASGLVLFVFLATHLLNHVLGLASLQAMEWGRDGFLLLWRSLPGTVLLYGALAVHVALVGQAIFRRRSLRMPPAEILQMVLGLLVIPTVALHVTANRGAHEVLGVEDSYAYVLLSLWLWDWKGGLLQTAATLIAWTHGCLGVYFWLRLKPWFAGWQPLLYAGALLLPALGLAGFASGAKEAALLAADPMWLERQVGLMKLPGAAGVAWVYGTAEAIRLGALGFAVGVLGLRAARIAWERRRGRFTVGYPNGRQVVVEAGTSVREASRIGGVPHASACGGRGRCSTCRVRIADGFERLPLPAPEELKVLLRVRAGERDRLACQLRPSHDVAVVPLLPAAATPRDGYRRPAYLTGSEREIAILFADLRAFTRFSESKLPYDLVFVINQYFRAMGTAIELAGGRLDKFIGDGVMALFGIDSDLDEGCRRALEAARLMSIALAELNRHLAADLEEPLRMGIGIHAGPAIVGEMGYRHAISLTAIGDAVNTASRLEGMTKELGTELVVSERVAEAGGLDTSGFELRTLQVRGRRQPLKVYGIPDAAKLPEPGAAAPARAATPA